MSSYVAQNFATKLFLQQSCCLFVTRTSGGLPWSDQECFYLRMECQSIAGLHPALNSLVLPFTPTAVDNINKLSTCVHAHKIFNKSSNIPSLFHDSLRTVSSLHKYNIRYAFKGNFHRPKVRTNTDKFTFGYAASKLWETVPTNLKRLCINNFKKRYKNDFLKCQS